VSPVGIGASMDAFSRPPMLRRLRAAGVAFLEYHTLSAVRPGVAEVTETLTGVPRPLAADSVVGASYGVADDALFGELLALSEAGEAPGLGLHAVGGCLAPRQAIEAIWDACRVARALWRPVRIPQTTGRIIPQPVGWKTAQDSASVSRPVDELM